MVWRIPLIDCQFIITRVLRRAQHSLGKHNVSVKWFEWFVLIMVMKSLGRILHISLQSRVVSIYIIEYWTTSFLAFKKKYVQHFCVFRSPCITFEGGFGFEYKNVCWITLHLVLNYFHFRFIAYTTWALFCSALLGLAKWTLWWFWLFSQILLLHIN